MTTFRLIEDDGRIVGYVDDKMVSVIYPNSPHMIGDNLAYTVEYNRAGNVVYFWYFIARNDPNAFMRKVNKTNAIVWTIENQKKLSELDFDYLVGVLEIKTDAIVRF